MVWYHADMLEFPMPNCWMTVSASSGWNATWIRMGFHAITVADTRTSYARIVDTVPAGSTRLYTDEWQSLRRSHPSHVTVRHGTREWAWDADGIREAHCNTCEGAGAALRTYLRAFGGVHKRYLHLYVAT
jgi:hypothetical protein